MEWILVVKKPIDMRRLQDNRVSVSKYGISFSRDLKEFLLRNKIEVYISSDRNFMAFKPTDNESGYYLDKRNKSIKVKTKNLKIDYGIYNAEWDNNQEMIILDLRTKELKTDEPSEPL